MTVLELSRPQDGGVVRGARIELTPDELLIITNALNEVCNSLEMPEFSTRIGADRAEALELLREMSASYDEMAQQKPASK
jgi:hypothetical protein